MKQSLARASDGMYIFCDSSRDNSGGAKFNALRNIKNQFIYICSCSHRYDKRHYRHK
jgi:hypothetical protein